MAVKTLADISLSTQEDEFQREINVFSELQHENIACLKVRNTDIFSCTCNLIRQNIIMYYKTINKRQT